MEYGMLTTLIPEAYDEEFRQICRHTMQDAANVLQQNLYEGLCAELGHTIPVFNILPVSSFPQYCSRACFRRKPLGMGAWTSDFAMSSSFATAPGAKASTGN